MTVNIIKNPRGGAITKRIIPSPVHKPSFSDFHRSFKISDAGNWASANKSGLREREDLWYGLTYYTGQYSKSPYVIETKAMYRLYVQHFGVTGASKILFYITTFIFCIPPQIRH